MDINWIIDKYLELENKEDEMREAPAPAPAENFVMHPPLQDLTTRDELIIDQNLTGVDYKLAKCCNPIYGDEIFALFRRRVSEFIGSIVPMLPIYFHATAIGY